MKTNHMGWYQAAWLACFAALGLTMAPSAAFAATVDGNSSAETIVVGSYDFSGGGAGSATAIVCFDRPGTASDTYVSLGTTSGLNDNYQINGLAGTDVMEIRTGATAGSGYCGTAGLGGSGWYALEYNGHFCDLNGGADGDTMYSGSGDTYMFGGTGTDSVYGYTSIGDMFGGDGADDVWGLSAGAGDALNGENGNDCLYDSTNSWAVFNCGEEAGDNDLYSCSNSGVPASCETSSCSCGI